MLSLAQQSPIAFASTYTYGEKEGIITGNWVDINQRLDGSIVARPYSSNYFHIKPYITLSIPFAQNLKGNEVNIYGESGDGNWFSGSAGISVFENDSIRLQYPVKGGAYIAPVPEKGILYLTDLYKNPKINWYNRKQSLPIALPPNENWDTCTLSYDFYTGLPCLLPLSAGKTFTIYRFNPAKMNFEFLARYPTSYTFGIAKIFGADSVWIDKVNTCISLNNRGEIRNISPFYSTVNNSGTVAFMGNNATRVYQYHPNKAPTYFFTNSTTRVIVKRDNYYNSYYIGTFTQLQRAFPLIQNYPNVYQGNNSLATHTLMQADDGTLYAGSYNGFLSAIHKDNVEYVDVPLLPILPGGFGIGNQLFYFTEKETGLYRFSSNKKLEKIKEGLITGFFLTQSRDGKSLYAGFAGISAFGITDKSSAINGQPTWKMVDSSKGIKLKNVVTITEDKQGRIWFGRNSQGWGVYYPATDTAETFLLEKNETPFGAISSACDNKGTLWLAGSKGLWYIDANKAGTIKPGDAKQLEHPLLPDGVMISAMKLWDKYLVLGAGKNLMLLDLETFHGKQQKVLRYFNPQELNFTADVEQNAILTDNRDSSLWIATSDNVYQIDLKAWLNLNTYTAAPTLQLITGTDTIETEELKGIILPATNNSLQMQVFYQTRDNMPRFMQMALAAYGDSMVWSAASLKNSLTAYNLQTGSYTFYVRILQSDGTITTHTFPITIRRFLWQQWWFWLLISAALICATVYLFYLHKQKQLAEANTARITAEAEALRSEQQRKLTAMQVKSLSTQFRPHFILNALNTVGAQLYDKPDVDAVLGQLGDSIGIIFRNAQAGSIAHPLSQEWRLVESVCSIKQMEFRHSIQIHNDLPQAMIEMENFLVPMGILQIPVENALIHGLRNKEEGPKDLWINMLQGDENRIIFTITDNGIGRKAAALISNYRRNGVGSKNMLAIINLLNQHNTNPIEYSIEDEVMEENGKQLGTRVIISIPKNYLYDT